MCSDASERPLADSSARIDKPSEPPAVETPDTSIPFTVAVVPPSKDLLIVIHGIRDMGTWGVTIKNRLENPNLTVNPIQYGYFNALRFVEPFYSRHWAVRYVETRVRYAIAKHRIDHPTARISLLAHSFGAYVVAEMLRRDPFLTLDNLALCGSVLSRSFAPDILLRQVTRFVNDCGNQDIWPVVAGSVTWGYGNTGTFGFGINAVDRFHKGKHSLFFCPKFIDTFWGSLFLNGRVVNSDVAPAQPTPLMQLFLVLPFRWLFALLVVVALWFFAPWLQVQLATFGVEVPLPTFRHTYAGALTLTPHYVGSTNDPLKPPNFNGKPETDLVRSMFVWKTWMENTAKPPDNQQQNMRPKATIVVTSEPFRGNYDTFNATVGIKRNWKIVEGWHSS